MTGPRSADRRLRPELVVNNTNKPAATEAAGPLLLHDSAGGIDYDSIPDVIQWFLDHDARVAIIKHPKVEELFQWKQQQSQQAGEDVFVFSRAEDRLAIGIIQSVALNPTEMALHEWIAQLLNALQQASRSTEDLASAYQLDMNGQSIVSQAEKIPAASSRRAFLIDCWLETLCTAEIRVLGWLYQEFYGRPFHPENF